MASTASPSTPPTATCPCARTGGKITSGGTVVVDDDGSKRDDDEVCAVCWERLEWVAIGGCGHPGVCAECTVRLRFAHGDRRCCICRKHCDTVVVTKGGGQGVYARMLASRPAADCRGFWYHHGSSTYFDDKGQYKAAKRECAGDEPKTSSKYCSNCKHRRPLFRLGCFS